MTPPEPVLLTLILKHHAGLVLDDIQSRLKASDWWERFPIEGTRVVSWTVAMGLGQTVTLEVPPHLSGPVNLELERSARGGFRVEVYLTSDSARARVRITERWSQWRCTRDRAWVAHCPRFVGSVFGLGCGFCLASGIRDIRGLYGAIVRDVLRHSPLSYCLSCWAATARSLSDWA